MKIRPYRPGDIEHMLHRTRDDFGNESLHGTRFLCEQGNTYVGEVDGVPVALWGTQIIWKGVVHVWTLITDDARGHGLSLTKTIKRMLDEFCIANNIVRCESVVKSDIEENIRWLKTLGFEYEATQKHASPQGGDLDIFVRFYHG